MIAHQSSGYAMPSRISWPAGVCIHELADRIQNAEVAVPMATITADSTCSQRGTRPPPNSRMARKLASRKNALSTS